MNTMELNKKEMEQANGGDLGDLYYHFMMGMMKLVLPDPSIPPVKRKTPLESSESPTAPVILPQNPCFPRDRVGPKYYITTKMMESDQR